MERNWAVSARLGGEHGGGRLKALVSVAVLAAMIYTGAKVVPILVDNYQFQDAMESTARFASVNRQTNEDIRASVLKEAQTEEIPVQPGDIHIKGDSQHVEISADYSVTVDLMVYRWTLNFHPSVRNNALL
jgi:hypothetical protein